MRAVRGRRRPWHRPAPRPAPWHPRSRRADHQARRLRHPAHLRRRHLRPVLRLRLRHRPGPPVPAGDRQAQHPGPRRRGAGQGLPGLRHRHPPQLLAGHHPPAAGGAAQGRHGHPRRLCRGHQPVARGDRAPAGQADAQAVPRQRLQTRALDRLRRGHGVHRLDDQPLRRLQHRAAEPAAARRPGRQARRRSGPPAVRPAAGQRQPEQPYHRAQGRVGSGQARRRLGAAQGRCCQGRRRRCADRAAAGQPRPGQRAAGPGGQGVQQHAGARREEEPRGPRDPHQRPAVRLLPAGLHLLHRPARRRLRRGGQQPVRLPDGAVRLQQGHQLGQHLGRRRQRRHLPPRPQPGQPRAVPPPGRLAQPGKTHRDRPRQGRGGPPDRRLPRWPSASAAAGKARKSPP